MPVSEKICMVTLSLYKKKGVKRVVEKKGQKLDVQSVSKGFVTELKGTVPSRDRKKAFFVIFFLTERNIGDIRTLGYVLIIF